MKSATINGYKINSPKSKFHLLDHINNYKGILVAMNAEKILKTDEKLKELINKNLGYPDGIGAVWALKQKGLVTTKIAGAEFWLDIVSNYYHKKSFYIVGATEQVIQKTILKLKNEFQGINVLGFRNGFINSEIEKKELIEDIKKKKPEVVFVAMGSPKQEYLMEEILLKHEALYMGLGGSFDLYMGLTKPVPNWWKKYFKWEGIYRSFNDITNVKRWKRQFILFKFLYKYLFGF